MTKVNKDIFKFFPVKLMKDSSRQRRSCLTIRIQAQVLRNQKRKCGNLLLNM